MKIYTKTGDKGQTSLFGGQRISKASMRVTSYGDIDELNSLLGVCRALNKSNKNNENDFLEKILHQLQQQLFAVGADLATPFDMPSTQTKIERIADAHLTELEKWIDEIDLQIQPLKNFILPGGALLASYLHLARSVCRRAERAIVEISHDPSPINTVIIVYVNRLSDLLFMMGRYANMLAKQDEEKWSGV